MKNLKFIKYLLSSILYIAIITFTIYLPVKINSLFDQQHLGTINFLNRSPIEFPHDSNIAQKLEIMTQARIRGLPAIRLFHTNQKSLLIDNQLIGKIQEEFTYLFSLQNLQHIAQYNLEDYFIDASYYSIQPSFTEISESNNVLVCKIRFSDFKTFDFSFVVDAQNYKIYTARITCKESAAYIDELNSNQVKLDQLNEMFRQSCQTYYEANTSSLYTTSQPSIILKLTYDNLEAFPSRDFTYTPMGIGIEIGFTDLLYELIYIY